MELASGTLVSSKVRCDPSYAIWHQPGNAGQTRVATGIFLIALVNCTIQANRISENCESCKSIKHAPSVGHSLFPGG